MVNFKEMFTPQRMVTKLGAISFPANIFKDEKRTPHYEMEKSLEMFQTRPLINSGVKQFARFVLGEGVTIKSADEKTHEFLNKWLDMRSNLQFEVFNMIVSGVCAGNVFCERTWKQMANGEWCIDNLYNINDVSRCYVNLDTNEDDDFWFYEVPIEVKRFPFGVAGHRTVETPKFFKVNYVYGSYLWAKMVWAIPLHKSKIAHLKIGWSKDGIYGRSFLSSSIDDGEILTEILKNYAIIARYRALGKKIFSIGTPEDPAGIDDIDKLESDLTCIEDRNHIIINKELKAEPLSYTGENDPMDTQLDFLRKDMTSGIIPNFLTPWNDEVNRATAGEVKIPFQLEIDSFKQHIVTFLNAIIIDELRTKYSFINEDATFTFGEVDLESKEEKMGYARDLYQADVITMNEYRTTAGFDAVNGGDQFVSKLADPEERKDMFAVKSDGAFKEDIDTSIIPLVKQFLLKHPNPDDTEVHKFSDEIGKDPHEVEEVIYLFATKGVQESFKEQANGESVAIDNNDDRWLGKLYKQGVLDKKKDNKITRRYDIRGAMLRNVKNEDGFIIFDGVEVLNQFAPDEGEVARLFFDKTKEKRIKALDDFYEGELPEDKVIDDFFDEIKRVNAEIIDEVFKELPKNKVQVEKYLKEKIGVGEGVLGSLGNVFSKFNDRLKDIVNKVTGKMLGLVVNPQFTLGKDVNASDQAKKQLEVQADILKGRMENQLKTVNQKMQNDIYQQISNGIMGGQTQAEVKQGLKDKFANFKTKENPQDWQLDRIARTEIANGMTQMTLMKWKNMGFEKAQHRTVMERRDPRWACNCKQLNMKVFNIDDLMKMQIGAKSNKIPVHPNCRCQYTVYE